MRRSARVLPGLLAVVALGAVGGCGGGEAESDAAPDGRLRVAAGFYPLAFAAEEIGGGGVDVENLTPPGVEPHDLELSARDVERIQAADLVLYLGGGFQPAVEEAALRSAASVDLLDAVDLIEGGDPHVWLDPVRYGEVAARLGKELQAEEAAADFSARLAELDRELEEGLADCERRSIVTSHEAFGYLADRYGLEQIGVTGLEPEAEPAPQDLADVVDAVRETGATTVFVETLVSPDLAETVAREAGATVATLDPLEGLSEDALAEGSDYFSVMRENLAALREALGCR
jgi:zinc transport system substrate-binding protein